MKFIAQRQRLTERPNDRTIKCTATHTHTPHHNIIKGLFILLLFTQSMMSNYEKKIIRHTKVENAI